MPFAVLYARFSPRPNQKTCDSSQAQLEALRAHMRDHNYIIRAEFKDDAVSGSEEDRPGLWEAISALRPNDVLAVTCLDRLARSTYFAVWLERELARIPARVFSLAGEGSESDTPEAALMRTILYGVAEYSRKLTSAKLKAATQRRHAMGYSAFTEFSVPYGYQMVPGQGPNGRRFEKCPHEQVWLEKIKQAYLDGWSLKVISLWANKGQRKGRKWRMETLIKVLKRLGVYAPRPRRKRGYQPFHVADARVRLARRFADSPSSYQSNTTYY